MVALPLLALVLLVLWLRRPPTVEVAQVRQARVGEEQMVLSASGFVSSRRRSVVAPKVPGRLDELLVDEGQRVQEGEVIARLDPEDADVALAQARAEAKAAHAALLAARTRQEQASRELERTEVLAEAGSVTRQALDRARDVASAAAAELSAARARVEAARQAVAASRIGVESTLVRAPFTGTVVKKIADEGAVLAPATISTENVGGIVEIVDLSQLEVEAEVGEEDLGKLKVGQPALIALDAFPDTVWRGEIESFRPAIDRAKATGVVKVRFVDPPKGVLPDMAARISFLRQQVSPEALSEGPTLRVPASAVVERDGAPVVLTVEGDRIREVPVKPTGRAGEEVVLEEGPKPGTQVVLAPGEGLKAGKRVRVQQEGGA